MKTIYLAGSLFTVAEINFNEKVCGWLQNEGFKVFLPQQECKDLTDTKVIFETCKNGIDNSDIIVAILDGADADSGTCWEFGYGYANQKHLIGIRTDFRGSGDTGGFNAMLYHSANFVIDSADFYAQLKNYLNKIK